MKDNISPQSTMTSTGDSSSGPRVNLLPNASNFTIHDGHFLAAGCDLYYTASSPDIKSKILQWLKAPDPSPNFYAARDEIQKGTGLWFLADTRFINWKQNPGLLWMQGKAGSGKTFLCTNIIQELLNSSDHTSILLVHYFDSRTESKRSYRGCLLSFLAQGAMHFQGVPSELEHMFKDRKNVFEEPSIQDIDKVLKTLPETLEQTYSEQLSKIKEFNKEEAKILLQWLTFSFEPLSILQCQEILTVDLDKQIYNPEKRESGLLQRLHKIVGSVLITISSEEVVQLAHHSVKEFLSCTYTVTPSIFFQIHDQLAHQVIAQTCLLYLQHYYAEHNASSTMWPLADYAAVFWIQHRENISVVDSILAHLCIQLFQEPAWSTWKRTWKLWRWILEEAPIIFAASHGLEEVVKHFLALDTKINHFHGDYYGTILQAAAANGHESMVKLLLESGADVKAQGGEYGYALQAAASGGHESVMKLLLDSGADVNAQGGLYGNALQAAAYKGHKSVVKLLLDSGADVKAQGGKYGYALQAAASGGHESVVKLLLDSGTDVNVQGGVHGTALLEALKKKHDSVAKPLPASGAKQHRKFPRWFTRK